MSFVERIRAANERIRVVEAALPARGLTSTDPWRLIGDPGEPGWVSAAPADGWTPVSGSNWGGSFAGYSPPPVGFFRDAVGFMHLRGVVAIETATSPSGTSTYHTVEFFFLPFGYRPSAMWRRGVASNSGNTRRHNLIRVETGGLVKIEHSGSPYASWVSLDGLSFPTYF